MKPITKVLATVALSWLPLSMPVYAEGVEPGYNRVDFQVEESREVDNDQMQVTLSAEEENRDAAQLASRINNIMLNALSQVRKAPTVHAQSGSYRVTLVYDSANRLKRWKGSQILLLRSTDMDSVSALVGKLQNHLKVKSMVFSVSQERRRGWQRELIDNALDAFRARARQVAKRLGFSTYRIVNLSINNRNGQARPMMRREMFMSQSPVAVEAGRSRLVVSIHGTIELTGLPG